MGSAKKITGIGEKDITLEKNDTLNNLLKRLHQEYGEPFNEIYNPEKSKLNKNIVVTLNGISHFAQNTLNINLNDGDTIVIAPPIAGG